MGNPSPVYGRGLGRPKTTNVNWHDPEQVRRYHHERRLIRKQARQQREAAEQDSDIAWGEDGARLWGLEPNQFYYRASHGFLPSFRNNLTGFRRGLAEEAEKIPPRLH